VKKAMVQVADYLGNTPRVARRSYVDPRVIDRFEEGVTIAPTLRRATRANELDEQRERLERAVIRMLQG
jgi:DNA topoisomerase IB